MECVIPPKHITKVNRIIGIGTTLHKFIERNSQDILFPYISYQLTQTDVRLFSPQTYHQMYVGHYVVQVNQFFMHFPFHRIHIPVDLGGNNLPLVHNLFVTEHQKRSIGPHIRSSLSYTILSELERFGDMNTIISLQDTDISSNQMKIECEFEHHYSHFCGVCFGAPANQNLY